MDKSTKKPGILYVNLQKKSSGAEKSLLAVIKSQIKFLDIFAACPCGCFFETEFGDSGIKTYRLFDNKYRYFTPIGLVIMLINSWQLIFICLRCRADIVHANTFPAAMVCAIPAFLGRKKLIWHSREIINRPFLMKVCSYFCDSIIAISSMVERHLIDAKISPGKITLIHNGIDVPTSGIASKEISKEQCVFANIGQFVPWKRQLIFLRACKIVQKELPFAQFLLIGNDVFSQNRKYKNKLIAAVKKLQIENLIICPWQEDMEKMWGQITCLVHTARQEPFGRVILEAMAHRTAVVGIKGEIGDEIAINNNTILLAEGAEPGRIAEKMIAIACDRELYEKISENAFELAGQFSVSKTADSILALYKDILKTPL